MNVALIGNYFSQNLGDDLYKLLLEERYPQHRFIPHSVFKQEAKDCGLIIVGGGGILYDNSPRLRLAKHWAELYGCRWCVMSCGWAGGSTVHGDSAQYRAALFVTVRDHSCYEAIDNAELLPDLAWTYEPHELSGERSMLGVALRHSTRYNTLGLANRFNAIVHKRYSKEQPVLQFNTYGERILHKGIPYCTTAGMKVTYDIYRGTDIRAYLDRNYNRLHECYAMPYHAIVLAAIYGVPVGGWSYSTKTDYLAKETALPLVSRIDENPYLQLMDPAILTSLRRKAARHYELLDSVLA